MKNSNRASRGVTVNTKQDLTPLTEKELRKLRSKADEMGLREFRDRIDEHLLKLKTATGTLSEREQAYLALGWRGPVPGKHSRANWTPLGELIVEAPETEFLPTRAGGGWVWEKSGSAALDERHEIYAERDEDAMEGFHALREALERARESSAKILLILYRPTAKGGKHFRSKPGMEGEVLSVNRKTGGFKLRFVQKGGQA